jgi:hypothetical protein
MGSPPLRQHRSMLWLGDESDNKTSSHERRCSRYIFGNSKSGPAENGDRHGVGAGASKLKPGRQPSETPPQQKDASRSLWIP